MLSQMTVLHLADGRLILLQGGADLDTQEVGTTHPQELDTQELDTTGNRYIRHTHDGENRK